MQRSGALTKTKRYSKDIFVEKFAFEATLEGSDMMQVIWETVPYGRSS